MTKLKNKILIVKKLKINKQINLQIIKKINHKICIIPL